VNPALFPAALDNGALDELDGNGRLIDTQNAGSLARRGADAPRELRKVVGGVKAANGGLPAAVVDQVVPVGNEVVDRAAGVAEGDAAIHAARALLALFFFRKRLVNFEPVVDPLFDFAAGGLLALNF
jgi:hypothetical protein